MIKFIIFNGPPGSGKTVTSIDLSSRLQSRGYKCIRDGLAWPMKNFIAYALGQKYEDIRKDEANPVLLGETVRNFLIDLSEHYMKPAYSQDVFGRMLYHRVTRVTPPPDFVILDDCGFEHEIDPLGEPRNRFLIKMERPGHTFDGDSRSYWRSDDKYDFIFFNDGSDDDRIFTIEALIHKIIWKYSEGTAVQ